MTVNVTEERLELTALDKASAIINAYKGNVDGLRTSMDSLKGTMTALGVLGAVGVAASFAMAVRETMSWEAGLYDLSQRTGTTVEDLSALSGVARRSGTDMDAAATMLQKLSKNMAEAGDGGSKAAKVFKALGIEVTDANTGALRPALDVARELGEKLGNMTDKSLALAFAQEAMGKAGANQLPFLRALVEAGQLHAKVTTEQAREAKLFEDSMDKLGESSKNLKIAFANDLLPSLNATTKAMLEARQAGEGFFGVMQAGIQTTLTGTDLHKWNVEFVKATEAQQNALNLLDQARATYIQTSAPFDADQVRRFYQELLKANAELERLQRIKGVLVPEAKPAAAAAQTDVANPLGGSGDSMSKYDSAVLHLQQMSAKAASGGSQFMATQLDLQAEKFGTLTEAQKRYLVGLAAQADREKSMREFDEQRKKDMEDAAKAAQENLDRINAAARQTVAAIEAGMMSEEDVVNQHYDDQFRNLEEALRLKQITQEKYNSLIYLMEDQQGQKISAIRKKNMTDQQKIDAMGYREQASMVTEELVNMTSTVSQHSRALFELNKVAAIATLALKAPEAIASSFAFGTKFGGPVLGYAMAGVAAAAMAVQASAIASAKFGGSSSPSIAGGTSAPPVSAVPAPVQQQQSPKTVILNIDGDSDSVSRNALRRTLEAMNEEVGDGARHFILADNGRRR